MAQITTTELEILREKLAIIKNYGYNDEVGKAVLDIQFNEVSQ